MTKPTSAVVSRNIERGHGEVDPAAQRVAWRRTARPPGWARRRLPPRWRPRAPTPAAARPTGASVIEGWTSHRGVRDGRTRPRRRRNALRTRLLDPPGLPRRAAAALLGHSRSPSSVSAAGAMNIRTSVMSTSTAVASPSPVILITGSGSVAKPMKTAIMIAARGRDDLARPGRGGRDRGAVVRVAAPLLAHAREQEDVVVGREPEQDREHEQRHVGDDGLLLDAQQARTGRGLEREGDDAVGGGDRREVEDAPTARAIRHDRKAASRSSSDRPTTAAANSGMREAIFSASSPKRAVRPPT